MEDENIREEEKEQEQGENGAREVVNTIIQNGVSKEELKAMLQELLKPEEGEEDKAKAEQAEKEYFNAMLKGEY